MALRQGVKADCSDGVEEEQKQEGEQKESEGSAEADWASASAVR